MQRSLRATGVLTAALLTSCAGAWAQQTNAGALKAAYLPVTAGGGNEASPAGLPEDAPVSSSSSSAPGAFAQMEYTGNTDAVTLSDLPRHFIEDQAAIFTSPAHVRWADARYLVPLATFTGLLIASDHHTETALVHPGHNDPNRASDVADAGVGALGAVAAALLFNGYSGDNSHQKEAGLLSVEAVADTMLDNNLARVIFTRERPDVDDGRGKFFQGTGAGLAFPSNHAAAAWSLAAVLGQEYPGPLSRAAVYSMATAVSISRVAGQQHFPSDVLVGSALGYLTGRYVYRARHDNRFTDAYRSADPEPSGPAGPLHVASTDMVSNYNSAAPADVLQASRSRLLLPSPIPVYTQDGYKGINPDTRGSVYVPMDSWVYPALDRLAGLGFVPSQSVLIRPWTREECLRQIQEAQEQISQLRRARGLMGGVPSRAAEGMRLIADLEKEFAAEHSDNESMALESVYSRGTVIAGPALTRSWDFGQTLDNDYGRAFARGFNAIGGFAVAARTGRWSFYARDEYQHAPGYSTYSPSVYDFILSEGNVQIPPQFGDISTVNRNRPIEMYAGYEAKGFELQFGKQEMYWGPSYDGPLAFSINAEPTYNFQAVTTRPHQFPGPLAFLGTYRFDLMVGKLSGHTSPARPWVNGQKFTFNFTDNFEVGITRWSLWAGVGTPFTIGNFFHNIFSFSSNLDQKDPGDRKTGIDFRYRLPGVRWVTVYADGYADDAVNPLESPRRSVWMPGIYLSRIPGIPHVDFRFETPSTLLLSSDHGPYFSYSNDHYVDANLNKGFFYGNSVGRDGRRYEGWTSYWFSGNTRAELGYRQTQRSNELLPVSGNPNTSGGGTQSDAMLRGTVQFSQHWSARAMAQYERWYEPVLNDHSQHNVTGQLELRWEPKVKLER